jgi:hypothetical protein
MRALVLAGALLLAACSGDDEDPRSTTCEWQGMTYQDQEIFPAGDGCNTCQCGADGQEGRVGCTLVACEDAGTPDAAAPDAAAPDAGASDAAAPDAAAPDAPVAP